MREKKDTDFTVTLEGVGDFRYCRRTLGDSIKIRSAWLDIVGQHGDDEEMAGFANIVATHRVLCVNAPEGWEDLEKLDSIKYPDLISKVIGLYELMREKEDSFRGSAKGASEEIGA